MFPSSLKTPGLRGPDISKTTLSPSITEKMSIKYLELKAISFSSPFTFASTSTLFSPIDEALDEKITLSFLMVSFITFAASLAKTEQILTAFCASFLSKIAVTERSWGIVFA